MSESVRVRDCACPGVPHPDGDLVYLRPTITLEGGLEAEAALLEAIRLYPDGDEDAVASQRTAYLRPRWFATFLRHGAEGWNLEDENGPVPFDVDALIADYGLARAAADAATDLYSPAVLAPFQNPPPRHSRNGRTAGGTRPPSTPTPLRSRRSSPPGSVDGRPSAERAS